MANMPMFDQAVFAAINDKTRQGYPLWRTLKPAGYSPRPARESEFATRRSPARLTRSPRRTTKAKEQCPWQTTRRNAASQTAPASTSTNPTSLLLDERSRCLRKDPAGRGRQSRRHGDGRARASEESNEKAPPRSRVAGPAGNLATARCQIWSQTSCRRGGLRRICTGVFV
jgi:hypothetical protein